MARCDAEAEVIHPSSEVVSEEMIDIALCAWQSLVLSDLAVPQRVEFVELSVPLMEEEEWGTDAAPIEYAVFRAERPRSVVLFLGETTYKFDMDLLLGAE